MWDTTFASDRITKPWLPNRQRDYVLANATIVDPLDGSIHKQKNIHLSNGRITDIIDAQSPQSYHGQHIDCSGLYVCPGLIDCHVHLAATPGEEGLTATMSQDPTTSLLRQPYSARQMLTRGFTTIRDCGGATLAMKEAVAEGLHSGPRMFIAGHTISQTGGHGDRRGAKAVEVQCCGGHIQGNGRIADGVAQCLHAARDELRSGADFLKIMCSGGVASPTDRLTSTQYTPEEVRAITKVASDSGTYVTAHAYTPAAIRNAVENGVRGIEHGNLIDEPTAKLMAERGAFLTPTLITYKTMASEEFRDFLPGSNAAKNLEVLEKGLESIRIADKAGVTMCYGTDLLGPLQKAQTGEFALRAQVLSPLKVLQSATINAARLLQQEDKLGRVEKGYLADLLIMGANPLEDVRIFDDSARYLLAVIKEGRVMTSQLPLLSPEI